MNRLRFLQLLAALPFCGKLAGKPAQPPLMLGGKPLGGGLTLEKLIAAQKLLNLNDDVIHRPGEYLGEIQKREVDEWLSKCAEIVQHETGTKGWKFQFDPDWHEDTVEDQT